MKANYTFAFLLSLSVFVSCSEEKSFRDQIYEKPEIRVHPVVKYLSPQESLETMHLPAGFRIEIVASEPLIREPVSIAWDGDGQMYVAQMMTYMQDIDATGEDEPRSRISILKDTDGDGVMDKSETFIDSMLLPRIMLPLDKRVVVGETYHRNLYTYRDTNGDGRADEKILLLADTVRDRRNLEHQDANMIWGLDNWLYVTNKAFRYRFTDGIFVRDTLPEPVLGQWGLTQDETGRLFFSRAGAEVPALGFQQPPVYGSLDLKSHWDESFMEPWPIVGTLDVQGGTLRIREDIKTLNRFTGVAGQEIFLGDRLPGAYGDLFIPEPVGRLIRRAKVKHLDGKIFLENPYHQTEFLASTDPLFRPVFTATGPDGCLYIADMYRGIIQEGNWVKEGSYLREVVKEKGLDKFVSNGRIYRIVHEDMEPGQQPKLLDKSADELLSYLAHPNGWWRNTAQKLIILKGDKTVIPSLVETLEDNESSFFGWFEKEKDPGVERLHALWTLEGLGAIDKPVLKTALKDKDYRVRVAAIRISDRYITTKDPEILATLKSMASDPHPEVLQQLILTFRLNNDETKPLVQTIIDRHPENELIKATAAENMNPSFSVIQTLRQKFKLRGGDAANQIVNGYKIFNEYCSACHGTDGKGIPQLGPTLVGSPRVVGPEETTIAILLHGLTGPVDGVEYNGPMAAVAQYSDREIANIASYVRGHLNDAPMVGSGRVRTVREKFKDRKSYWTLRELKNATTVVP
jgi:mono/diheme cytochrome c family protein/glucose/arabinose dehydrogenase